MYINVPAGKAVDVDIPGSYFELMSCQKAFKLLVREKGNREHVFEGVVESAWFDLQARGGNRTFTSLQFDNKDGTDDLDIVFNVADFPLRTNMTRTPPTSINPLGVILLATAGDTKVIGGGDTQGRRRMKLTVELISDVADGACEVGIYQPDTTSAENEIYRLIAGKVHTWSDVVDSKVTLKGIGGKFDQTGRLRGYETKMLA